MSLNPRHLVIRLFTPLVWAVSPRRQLATIQRFALIERDSGCQLLHCQRLIPDVRLRSYLFQHVLEEFYHGDIFQHLAKTLSDRHLYEEILPRDDLLDESAGPEALRDFFAYVHVGEQAVNRDFLVYSNVKLDGKVRAVFRRAGMDEGKHEHDTDDILLDLCGGDKALFLRTVLKARLKRVWKLYTTAMQGIGVVPLTLMLSGIYFIAGALGAHSARRRLELGHEEQLAVFKEQVREFEEGVT